MAPNAVDPIDTINSGTFALLTSELLNMITAPRIIDISNTTPTIPTITKNTILSFIGSFVSTELMKCIGSFRKDCFNSGDLSSSTFNFEMLLVFIIYLLIKV
ncbi:protein of unknown function [Tenacibaculum sp. 190524A05c]